MLETSAKKLHNEPHFANVLSTSPMITLSCGGTPIKEYTIDIGRTSNRTLCCLGLKRIFNFHLIQNIIVCLGKHYPVVA